MEFSALCLTCGRYWNDSVIFEISKIAQESLLPGSFCRLITASAGLWCPSSPLPNPPQVPPSSTVLHTFSPRKHPCYCLMGHPAIAKSLRFLCRPPTPPHTPRAAFQFLSPQPCHATPPPSHFPCLLFTLPNTPSPQG